MSLSNEGEAADGLGGYPTDPVAQNGSPTAAANPSQSQNGSTEERPSKKIKFEEFFTGADTLKRAKDDNVDHHKLYLEAVKKHPFVDKCHYRALVTQDAVIRDAEGNIACILIKNAYPSGVARDAASVLRTAPTRTSLRANIFGGESPLSGIAGYYDYNGSPVDLKCRKTSFTCEVINRWEKIFPLIEYVSQQYQRNLPSNWKAQDAAIPDVVRIHGSPFSTLTINQRFRTARHTDAGDCDAGYGCLTVLEGKFEGLHLGMPELGLCVRLQPTDVLLFNTHHWHCNTEPEELSLDWERLVCVFYYRAALGEPRCLREYHRRLKEAKKEKKTVAINEIVEKDNGENLNRAAIAYPFAHVSPFLSASFSPALSGFGTALALLHRLTHCNNDQIVTTILCLPREVTKPTDGLPLRELSERFSAFDKMEGNRTGAASQPKTGGFSSSLEKNNESQHQLLALDSLEKCLPGALFEMWKNSRTKWLELVERDWEKLTSGWKDRTEFTWKNKSDMNTAFFDLCEVASQVLLLLLGKEEASPAESNAFWAVFASHLFNACKDELKMPPTAMSMRKLNVKLKDFQFGGTRYFKDMPEDEQERRLLRKKRIEQARRGMLEAGANGQGEVNEENWLLNDDFDYQSEEKPVEYEDLDFPAPAEYLGTHPVVHRVKSVPLAVQEEKESKPMARQPTDSPVKVLVLETQSLREPTDHTNSSSSASAPDFSVVLQAIAAAVEATAAAAASAVSPTASSRASRCKGDTGKQSQLEGRDEEGEEGASSSSEEEDTISSSSEGEGEDDEGDALPKSAANDTSSLNASPTARRPGTALLGAGKALEEDSDDEEMDALLLGSPSSNKAPSKAKAKPKGEGKGSSSSAKGRQQNSKGKKASSAKKSTSGSSPTFVSPGARKRSKGTDYQQYNEEMESLLYRELRRYLLNKGAKKLLPRELFDDLAHTQDARTFIEQIDRYFSSRNPSHDEEKEVPQQPPPNQLCVHRRVSKLLQGQVEVTQCFATDIVACLSLLKTCATKEGPTYDVVIGSFLLSHCRDAEVTSLLGGIQKVLKPGGAFFLTETDLNDREYFMLRPGQMQAHRICRLPCFQALQCAQLDSRREFWCELLGGEKNTTQGSTCAAVPSSAVPQYLRTEKEIRELFASMQQQHDGESQQGAGAGGDGSGGEGDETPPSEGEKEEKETNPNSTPLNPRVLSSYYYHHDSLNAVCLVVNFS